MTKSELNDPYFEWMYRLVVDDRYSNKSYRRLFYKLHDTEFAYTIPMTATGPRMASSLGIGSVASKAIVML